MTIETEHRGHRIVYGMNSEDWFCHDVGFSSPSLSKVKQRIDKMYVDQRKRSAVEAFEIEMAGSFGEAPTKVPASITEYVGPKMEKDFRGVKRELIQVGHLVASVAKRGSDSKAARRDRLLDQMMPDTPEAHAAHEEYLRAVLIVQQAKKAAHEAFKAIPRMTIDMIADLVRIKESGDASE